MQDATVGPLVKPLRHAERNVGDMHKLLADCASWQDVVQLVTEWEDKLPGGRSLVLEALVKASETVPSPPERSRLAPALQRSLTAVLDQLCRWTLKEFERLRPPEAMSVLQSLARLQHTSPELTQVLVLYIKANTRRLMVDQLFLGLISLGRLDPGSLQDPELLDAVLDQAGKALKYCTPADISNTCVVLSLVDPERYRVDQRYLSKVVSARILTGPCTPP